MQETWRPTRMLSWFVFSTPSSKWWMLWIWWTERWTRSGASLFCLKQHLFRNILVRIDLRRIWLILIEDKTYSNVGNVFEPFAYCSWGSTSTNYQFNIHSIPWWEPSRLPKCCCTLQFLIICRWRGRQYYLHLISRFVTTSQ